MEWLQNPLAHSWVLQRKHLAVTRAGPSKPCGLSVNNAKLSMSSSHTHRENETIVRFVVVWIHSVQRIFSCELPSNKCELNECQCTIWHCLWTGTLYSYIFHFLLISHAIFWIFRVRNPRCWISRSAIFPPIVYLYLSHNLFILTIFFSFVFFTFSSPPSRAQNFKCWPHIVFLSAPAPF